jgi:hypothetical protein
LRQYLLRREGILATAGIEDPMPAPLNEKPVMAGDFEWFREL